MVDIIGLLNNIATDIVNAIPAIIAAVIIIAIGYGVATLVGRAVNTIVEKLGMEKSFDQTVTGKSFRSAGLDLSNFIGAVTKAFIIILSIILAIQVLMLEEHSDHILHNSRLFAKTPWRNIDNCFWHSVRRFDDIHRKNVTTYVS